jgi:NAD(P)-dependent dehydrogenase (short-subunit alcohol dehydrogenase family)
MSNSAGKSIFITGAGSGIGRATAKHFADRGWFVGLADIDAAGLAETQKLAPQDRQYASLFDVRDGEAWRQSLAQFADATGGKLHVLFNNAGIARFGWFEDVSEADANALIDINIKGVMLGCYAGLPLLKATHGARIINTASAAGMIGAPKLAVYAATKFAVRGLSEALDLEFERHGVRVSCLMPWFIETPLLDGNASGSNQRMRDSLGATKADIYPVELVAAAVWDVAHGDVVHAPVGKAAKRAWVMSRLFPNFTRRQIAKSLKQPQ